MDIFEFENQRFGNDLWDKKSIVQCRKSEPNEDSGTSLNEAPDAFYCWQGSKIPCWFE